MDRADDHWSRQRKRMVEQSIESRGISNRSVLEAMAAVPREQFLPAHLREFAYDDKPLPIEEGQTISQPYVVALMAAAAELGPEGRVLEGGAGSGYGAAVLSRIAGEVWSIERHEALATSARRRLKSLEYSNVHVIHGDGTQGWPNEAPYDAIVVTAGAPTVPEALVSQLAEHGRLIIPVGAKGKVQRLLRITAVDGETVVDDLGPVRFVPLVADRTPSSSDQTNPGQYG